MDQQEERQEVPAGPGRRPNRSVPFGHCQPLVSLHSYIELLPLNYAAAQSEFYQQELENHYDEEVDEDFIGIIFPFVLTFTKSCAEGYDYMRFTRKMGRAGGYFVTPEGEVMPSDQVLARFISPSTS